MKWPPQKKKADDKPIINRKIRIKGLHKETTL
jgi:hypothetical protein